MGQAFRKLFFGNPEIKVLLFGLGYAGKTTILYKLHNGTVGPSDIATIGFLFEDVRYKNVIFKVCEIGVQGRPPLCPPAPLWESLFHDTQVLIFVVDSTDVERIGIAKGDFQAIINHPLMSDCFILVFANKQDMEGAMTPKEVCDVLGLNDLKNHKWHIQGTCALKGDGLYEGLDWFIESCDDLKA